MQALPMQNEELVRAWVRNHAILTDSIVGAVVALAIAIQVLRWFRKTNLAEAKKELVDSLRREPVSRPPSASAIEPRTARIASVIFLAIGLGVIALTASLSWNEYRWIGAEVVPARFVALGRSGSSVSATYRVQPASRVAFIANFSSTPRGARWAEAEEAMRADRVVEIHPGEPLRYREHARSTGKDPHGWALVRFIVALGAGCGEFFLLGAFREHRAALAS